MIDSRKKIMCKEKKLMRERSKELIHSIIVESGLAPSDIARSMDISQARLSNWIRGVHIVPSAMLGRLQRASKLSKERFWTLVLTKIG